MIPRIAPMLASPKPLADEEGLRTNQVGWLRAVAYIEDGRAELVSRGVQPLGMCA